MTKCVISRTHGQPLRRQSNIKARNHVCMKQAHIRESIGPPITFAWISPLRLCIKELSAVLSVSTERTAGEEAVGR